MLWQTDKPGRPSRTSHPAEEDPALAPFLQVLDDHVSAHSEQLQPMTTDLVARLDDLVGAVDSESSWWLAPSVFLAVLGLILGLQGRWLKHC